MIDSSRMFGPHTKLQTVKVYINDVQLSEEDVVSYEIEYEFDKPYVKGLLSFKDSYDYSKQAKFSDKSIVKIYAVDFFGEAYIRTFVITAISHEEFNNRFKKYNIEFIDEIYYSLKNTYLSKGFRKDSIAAFKEYLDELETVDGTPVSQYLSDKNINLEVSESIEKNPFVVPQDRSILDFFQYKFRREGLRFYQNKNTVFVTGVQPNSVDTIQVNGENVLYSDSTANDTYAFKIYDFVNTYNKNLELNEKKPIQKHMKYDITKKNIDETTVNLEDTYDTLNMNSRDMSTLQHTYGEKYIFEEDIFEEKQMLEVQDTYLKNNKFEIVVPGNFKYNDIGKLVEVRLKGNVMYSETDLTGDVFHSGLYFVNKITDKVIGDKMIQKLSLLRVDFQEV